MKVNSTILGTEKVNILQPANKNESMQYKFINVNTTNYSSKAGEESKFEEIHISLDIIIFLGGRCLGTKLIHHKMKNRKLLFSNSLRFIILFGGGAGNRTPVLR